MAALFHGLVWLLLIHTIMLGDFVKLHTKKKTVNLYNFVFTSVTYTYLFPKLISKFKGAQNFYKTNCLPLLRQNANALPTAHSFEALFY